MRILVVDDHPMFRQGVVDLLAAEAEVTQAESGEAAVEAVRLDEFDVVLMDVSMPGMGGVEATRQVLAAQPSTAVVMLTMHPEHNVVREALAAGARGYLLKESSPREIRSALEAVTSGNAVLGAGVATQMLDALSRPPGNSPRLGGLTEREDEVLDLLAGGMTNREIAARLYLSDKTVRNYVSALFTKLHVTDRGGAVARARDLGYGSG